MMFAALHELARRAALHLLIVAEGERLRVTLQPRPTGDSTPVPPALQLVATPADFDAGFVEAVRTYQAPAASLIEQASGAAAAVAEAAEKQKTAAAKTPAKPAKKPAAKKLPKMKTPPHIVAAQQRAALERAEKAGESGGDPPTVPDIEVPNVTSPEAALARLRHDTLAEAAKARADKQAAAAERKRERDAAREAAAAERRALAQAKRDEAAARRAEKGPGRNASPADIEAARAACLVDARGYLALIGGAKPSRAAFLASMPPTGRRYERLFASWDEFVAAARQQELPIEDAGAAVAEVGASAETGTATDAGQTAETSTPDDPAPPETDAGTASASVDTPPAGDGDTVSTAATLALQTPSQTTEPVTLATMEAPPPQATDGLFSGEPQLDGDGAAIEPAPPLPAAPAHATTGSTPATIALDLI